MSLYILYINTFSCICKSYIYIYIYYSDQDGIFVLEPKSLEPYGRNYYVSEPVNTLAEPFLKALLDKTSFKIAEQFYYQRLDLINSNRVTILVFKK
ncbi:hypothetical protein Lalb_Chr24g0397381 [Lupinus albus]|uniref:Uncharacterized protein n=1 Tax=Lupinus albus TaxID=3870 RepID=A0A6A4N8A8_LUPAL|nr:hypothetical protein Lalb_Chr24g0397381 [Lupinus albus]